MVKALMVVAVLALAGCGPDDGGGPGVAWDVAELTMDSNLPAAVQVHVFDVSPPTSLSFALVSGPAAGAPSFLPGPWYVVTERDHAEHAQDFLPALGQAPGRWTVRATVTSRGFVRHADLVVVVR